MNSANSVMPGISIITLYRKKGQYDHSEQEIWVIYYFYADIIIIKITITLSLSTTILWEPSIRMIQYFVSKDLHEMNAFEGMNIS